MVCYDHSYIYSDEFRKDYDIDTKRKNELNTHRNTYILNIKMIQTKLWLEKSALRLLKNYLVDKRVYLTFFGHSCIIKPFSPTGILFSILCSNLRSYLRQYFVYFLLCVSNYTFLVLNKCFTLISIFPYNALEKF